MNININTSCDISGVLGIGIKKALEWSEKINKNEFNY